MRLKVTGEIIPNDYAWVYDFFGEEYFAPLTLDNALRDADPEDRELILEINSPGGFVFAGFETYSALQQLRAEGWHVQAEVTALAASAATTIMSACETVLCSPVAQIMIHLPAAVTAGNRFDHRDSIEVLKSLEESILNGYMAKVNGKSTREQLRRAMEKETWMPAQEAIDLGLADGILGDGAEIIFTAADIAALAGQFVNSIQNDFGMSYEAMLERYENGVRLDLFSPDPMHPVAGIRPKAEEGPAPDSWRLQARIDLEKERYMA